MSVGRTIAGKFSGSHRLPGEMILDIYITTHTINALRGSYFADSVICFRIGALVIFPSRSHIRYVNSTGQCKCCGTSENDYCESGIQTQRINEYNDGGSPASHPGLTRCTDD